MCREGQIRSDVQNARSFLVCSWQVGQVLAAVAVLRTVLSSLLLTLPLGETVPSQAGSRGGDKMTPLQRDRPGREGGSQDPLFLPLSSSSSSELTQNRKHHRRTQVTGVQEVQTTEVMSN